MQPRCGGQYRSGIQVYRLTLQVREHTSGLRDDHVERSDVQDVYIGLDDCIQLTGGQAVIVIIIAVATYSVDRGSDSAQICPLAGTGQ